GAGVADLAAMARAAGFRRAVTVADEPAWHAALDDVLAGPGPVFVGASVERGQEGPIRRGPHEEARYLRSSLADWSQRMRAALRGS
ncbi:MAG TPA: hypothetical protein VLL48_01790, partial [Longimicrobiales bacterium]|nr:hypothetical protein [Longimicrobiales bacterium]